MPLATNPPLSASKVVEQTVVGAVYKQTDNSVCNNEVVVSTTGNTIEAKINGKLSFETKYIVTFNDIIIRDIDVQDYGRPITFVFTTMSGDIAVSQPIFSHENDVGMSEMPETGTIKATAEVNNTATEAKSATLLLIFYDENNMQKAYVSDTAILAPQETKKLTALITQSDYGDGYCKAFVVDDIEHMNLLCNHVGDLLQSGQEKVQSFTNQIMNNTATVLESLNYSLYSDEMTINGKVSGPTFRNILITIKERNSQNLVMTDLTMCKADGTFDYKFNLGDLPNATYDILDRKSVV